jgi:hypothetical protein
MARMMEPLKEDISKTEKYLIELSELKARLAQLRSVLPKEFERKRPEPKAEGEGENRSNSDPGFA